MAASSSVYDAGFMMSPSVADRISHVIAPEGKVIEVYSSLDPEGHVKRTTDGIRRWKAQTGTR